MRFSRGLGRMIPLCLLVVAAACDQSGASDSNVADGAGSEDQEGLRGTYFRVDGYGRHRHRTFLPDSHLYSGVPAGGPEVFGLEQARRADPRELGTYTLQGDSIYVTWGGGESPETFAFAQDGEKVRFDGYAYSPPLRYADGHRLSGRYTTRSHNSMGIVGGGTMTWGGSATMVFNPDGTFNYGRAGQASTSAGISGSGAERTQGRYEINGNTITLTFGDGTVQHALIHPWAGEEGLESPESLNLNGGTYVRED